MAPSTLVMLLNGNRINLLINVAHLQVHDLVTAFVMTLTFRMGRFLPRGRRHSRNSYTHPSRLLQLSWCSWEKAKWVKKGRKEEEDRRHNKQQVTGVCVLTGHTRLNQQNTLSPAVTSQFSEMPAAKKKAEFCKFQQTKYDQVAFSSSHVYSFYHLSNTAKRSR